MRFANPTVIARASRAFAHYREQAARLTAFHADTAAAEADLPVAAINRWRQIVL